MAVQSQALHNGAVADDRPARAPSIFPRWARFAGIWLSYQPMGWRMGGALLGMISAVAGFILLVFGGYWSIQGVRVPLSFLVSFWGIAIDTATTPGILWWMLPLLTNFVQIFTKRVPFLKVFWRPTVVYDSMSTAVFLSLGIIGAVLSFGASLPSAFVITSIVVAVAGLATTLLAEKLFLGGLMIAWSSLRGG
jgi:hypothetical protein